MKKTAAAVLALLLGSSYAETTQKPKVRLTNPDQPCRVKPNKPILGASNETLAPVKDVPDTWIWNDVNGKNYLTNIKN
jgi:hypothetical protein